MEVLDLLARMQLCTHRDEASRVGQQLLDDQAGLVQLSAARHGELFDQFDAHGFGGCFGCGLLPPPRLGEFHAVAEAD